ncbi:Protein of unknown function, partial [Gryllus bimaculatus]
ALGIERSTPPSLHLAERSAPRGGGLRPRARLRGRREGASDAGDHGGKRHVDARTRILDPPARGRRTDSSSNRTSTIMLNSKFSGGGSSDDDDDDDDSVEMQ